MAIGTITQLNLNPQLTAAEGQGGIDYGPLLARLVTVVGDSSYPTGGTSLSGSQLGFGSEGVVMSVQVIGLQGSASNNGAIQANWNNSTGKLQMFASFGTSPVGLVEVANAVNLSGLTVTLLVLGYPGL